MIGKVCLLRLLILFNIFLFGFIIPLFKFSSLKVILASIELPDKLLVCCSALTVFLVTISLDSNKLLVIFPLAKIIAFF